MQSLEKMKLLDAEDTTCRFHGHEFQVVFYCHTCQKLLCPRCLTRGQSSTSPNHTSHVYLEVKEAVEVAKDDIEKILAKIMDQFNHKKIMKIKLQTRLQTLKLELLRQKTVLDRRILSMKNTIQRKRFDFLKYLASLLQPPLDRIQLKLDLVENHLNRDIQLIRLAESLKLHDENQSLSFLRTFAMIKSEFQETVDAVSSQHSIEEEEERGSKELEDISKIDMTFRRELNYLSRTFQLPKKLPSPPRILKSWCTIGSNSVSLFWICESNISHIKSFILYYKMVPMNSKDLPTKNYYANMDHKSLCMEEYLSIRIRKFLPKRSQAVLRNLLPETMYVLILFSESCFARSLPCVAYVQTLKSNSECILDEISPVFYADRIRMSTKRHVRLMQLMFNTFRRFFWLIMLHIFISVLLIIFCWSDVSQTGWFTVLTYFKTTISLFF